MAVDADRDFFISYSAADADWAEWIAWRLEAAGYATTLQAWDFRPGGNFVADMQTALARSRRVIAVLSDAYVGSRYARAEWFAAFARDPTGQDGALLPVRIADCAFDGLLGQIVWIDLVGLDESEAEARLLDGVVQGRRKPRSAPAFPSGPKPVFPPLEFESPYRGLASFDAEHRADFYGRDRYIEAAAAALAERRMVCLVGASGSGKSSLLQSGLLPKLRDEGWATALCRPRDDPFTALSRGLAPALEPDLSGPGPIALAAARYADRMRADGASLDTLLTALGEGGRGIVVAIDQFEELFTQTPEADRAAFVELLSRAWARSEGDALWVISLRADFMEAALGFDPLHRVLQDAALLLGPMTEEELLAAVVEPARGKGVRFEAGLPERLVRDLQAGGAAARLPLLQFALSELWLRQRGEVIPHAAYDDATTGIGGIEGALRLHAERVYASFDAADQTRIRLLFRRLAHRGAASVDIGRSAPRSELEADWPLVAELARKRLIEISETGDGASVEIIHEALFRAWPALRGWIEEHREFDLWRQGLGEQADRWEAAPAKAKGDMLLRGAVLDLALARRAERPEELAPREAAFIAASALARRSQTRRRVALVASAFAAMLGVAALAGLQWSRAEAERTVAVEARQEAERQADLADARRLAGVARDVLDQNAGETGLAAMIAVAAQRRRPTPEAAQALRDALAWTPAAPEPAPIPWGWSQTAISADGRVRAYYREDSLAAFGDDVEPHATVHLLDAATLGTVAERRYEGSLQPVFSPDGRWMASGGAGRRLVVRDAGTGAVFGEEGYRFAAYPTFSPDGGTLYAARSDGVVEVRRAPDWAIARTLTFPVDGERGPPLIVDVTPDGGHLLLVDIWRAAYSVRTDGGAATVLAPYDGMRGFGANNATVGAASPTEPLAVVVRNNGEATTWDLSVGEPLGEVSNGAYARAAAFSPDGVLVAAANHLGTVVLRRIADGQTLHVWEHGAEVSALAFSPDGGLLVSAGEDGAAALWDVGNGEAVRRLRHDGAVLALAFDPADGTLLTGDLSGALTRFDVATGAVRVVRRFEGRVAALAVSGGRVAVSVQESRAEAHWEDIAFFDRETGAERAFVMRNANHELQQLSPDGARFATWDRQRQALTLWDTLTGEALRTIFDIDLGSYAFSPDGARVLVDLPSGPLRVIDTETGATLAELGEPGGVDAVMVRTEEGVVVTQGGNSIRGWVLETGAPLWTTLAEGDNPRLSGDGSRFVDRATDEGPIVVREAATGVKIASIEDKGWIRAVSIDASRLLTVRRIFEDDAIVAHEIVLWDVDRGVALRRAKAGPRLYVEALAGDRFAWKDTTFTDRGPTSTLTVLDARSGATLWTDDYAGRAFINVLVVAGAPDRFLVEDGVQRRLVDARTGHVLWRLDGGGLRAAALAPDGAWLAVANATSLDNQEDAIVLLDPADGAELLRIENVEPVRDLAATADGARIVAAVQNNRFEGLRVWSAADGRMVREIPMDATPRALVPLDEPDRIAVHDFSGGLRVFDVTTGEMTRRFSHAPRAGRVAHAARADRTVTWSGASLRFWDTRTGDEIEARVADGGILRAALSPDGRRVAYRAERPRQAQSGAEYEVVMLWAPGGHGQPVELPVEGLAEIAFDRTGTRLLLTGRNGAWLRVVDAETLRTLAMLSPLRDGRLGQSLVSGDGRALFVAETRRVSVAGQGQMTHALRAFDLDGFREIARIDYGGGDFHIAPDGPEVSLRGVDGRWRAYDPSSVAADPVIAADAPGARLETAAGSSRLLAWGYWNGVRAHDTAEPGRAVELAGAANDGDPHGVLAAALSPDGRFAAISLRATEWTERTPGVVALRSAETGAELAQLPVDRPMWQAVFVAGGEAVVLAENQFSGIPDDSDSLMLLWRWRAGEVRTLETDNPVEGLAVSADGTRFATVEGHVNNEGEAIGVRRLRLWSADGEALAETPLDFNAYRVAFAQDDRHIAVSGQGAARVYRVPDLSLVHGLRYSGVWRSGQDFSIQNVPTMAGAPTIGFAMGGRMLVAGSASGAVLVDVDAGGPTPLHDGGDVNRTIVSPDGALIAMQSDGFVSVWDVAARTPISRFAAPRFSGLHFGGADGRALLAAKDGSVIRLTWEPEALASRACALLAGGDWHRGAQQLLGDEIGSPCADD